VIATARVKHYWDTREYSWIVGTEYRNGSLVVSFRDGARVAVEVKDLLPPRYHAPNWDAVTFNEFEIVVPTADGNLEIPWSAIRVLTDPAFDAHLEAAAARDAQRIGVRLREFREQQDIGLDELAARTGLTRDQLARLEAGQAGIPLQTLDRVLEATGHALWDLVFLSEDDSAG
jgi:DNA-binding Xre family transcriptional regulator